MKDIQWTWIVGLVFAIIIAVFSVMNVEAVPVNYIFGTSEWPLVLVILGSALLGAAVSGFIALFRAFKSKHHTKEVAKDLEAKDALIKALKSEIQQLKKEKNIKQIDRGGESLSSDVVEVTPPENREF